MREKFKKQGVTLLELLIVITLMGLIFGLGIYPMLSQITLFREERSEIALFDDANLAVNYIVKDAMMAEYADDTVPNTPNEIVFAINAVSLGTGADPSIRTLHSVYYHQTGGDELHREHWDYAPLVGAIPSTAAGGTCLSDRIITDKLDGVAVDGNPANLPTFALVTTPNTQQHQLRCSVSLQDTDDPSIITRRDFDVMLRCKDASL